MVEMDPSESRSLNVEEFMRKHERALKGTEERLLKSDNVESDDEGWRSEALAVIADIQPFVAHISISEQLPCDENGVYMNLQTKEGAKLTIELSVAGFRCCAHCFDTLATSNTTDQSVDEIQLDTHYETPYALLGSISPAYRDSFCNELALRLQELCK